MKNFHMELVGSVVEIALDKAMNYVSFGTSVIPMFKPPAIRILFSR